MESEKQHAAEKAPEKLLVENEDVSDEESDALRQYLRGWLPGLD